MEWPVLGGKKCAVGSESAGPHCSLVDAGPDRGFTARTCSAGCGRNSGSLRDVRNGQGLPETSRWKSARPRSRALPGSSRSDARVTERGERRSVSSQATASAGCPVRASMVACVSTRSVQDAPRVRLADVARLLQLPEGILAAMGVGVEDREEAAQSQLAGTALTWRSTSGDQRVGGRPGSVEPTGVPQDRRAGVSWTARSPS